MRHFIGGARARARSPPASAAKAPPAAGGGGGRSLASPAHSPSSATAAPAPIPPNVAARLRVVSYNLLAERWTRDGQHAHASPQDLDAAGRTRRALAEIDRYSPDILCLQELQRDARDGPVAEWMARRGYCGEWVAKSRRLRGGARAAAARAATALAVGGGRDEEDEARGGGRDEDDEARRGGRGGSSSDGSGSSGSSGSDGGESLDEEDETAALAAAAAAAAAAAVPAAGDDADEGVALLWRAAAFELVEISPFRFAEAAPASRLLSAYGDAAVVAMLRHKASGRAIVAASAHIFWGPAKPEVKARQAALLARRCQSLARRGGGGGDSGGGGGGQGKGLLPVVIAGDFNSMPPAELCVGAGDGFDDGQGALDLFLRQGGADGHGNGNGNGDGNAGAEQEAAVLRTVATASAAWGPGSGVYRLLTTGTLPHTHHDHPVARAAAAAAAREGGGDSGRDDGGSRSGSGSGSASEKNEKNSNGGRRRHRRALSTRGLRLVTAHAALHESREPVLTTRTATFSGALDHIFVGGGSGGGGGGSGSGGGGGGGSGGGAGKGATMPWRVVATLRMPNLDGGPIPDATYPSDHLAVGADLDLLACDSD